MASKNTEKRREYMRKYREKNLERLREKDREYREKNPEKLREYNRKYREKNPEKLRQYSASYYQQNAEKLIERRQNYYENNREEVLKRSRSYYNRNREKWKREGQEKREQRNLQCETVRPKPDKCEAPGCTRTRVEWDHCHNTNLFRSWLCNRHNLAAGMCGDDPHEIIRFGAFLLAEQQRVQQRAAALKAQRKREDEELGDYHL